MNLCTQHDDANASRDESRKKEEEKKEERSHERENNATASEELSRHCSPSSHCVFCVQKKFPREKPTILPRRPSSRLNLPLCLPRSWGTGNQSFLIYMLQAFFEPLSSSRAASSIFQRPGEWKILSGPCCLARRRESCVRVPGWIPRSYVTYYGRM